jgi:mannose-6-phosphate isomerase-like protein (cupin superfamily)
VRRSQYKDSKPFVTKDGSQIRELMHPSMNGSMQQSLAEATVAAGRKTQLHQHAQTEELYHITAGQGEMTLADETFRVIRGDTVCIPPGTPHCIKNTGAEDLVFLCCCAPAYSHDDTQLLE